MPGPLSWVGVSQAATSHQIPHPYRKSSRAQAQRANRAIIFMALPLLPVLRRSAQTGHVAAICRAKSPTQIASVTAVNVCKHLSASTTRSISSRSLWVDFRSRSRLGKVLVAHHVTACSLSSDNRPANESRAAGGRSEATLIPSKAPRHHHPPPRCRRR